MANPYLEALGFKSGYDTQHLQKGNPQILLPSRFFDEANDLLGKAEPIVLGDMIPNLERYSGRWNPGGFMVFPLGVHEVLGSLRLHVYPQGISRETDHGPNIHNHAWHLFSRVLCGHYKDINYILENHGRVTDTDYNLEERGLVRLYKTERKSNGLDILVTDGTVVKPVPVSNKEISAGKCHTIEANIEYHLTTISQDQLAATLVLDSPAFANSTDVLISNASPHLIGEYSEIKEIPRQRRVVDIDTARLVKAQLMSEIRPSK